MSLQEYIDLGHSLETSYDPGVIKSMEEASLRVRVSRVEAVKYELQGELAKLASQTQLNLFASLAHTYEDRYYKTLYTFDNGTGNLGVSFSGIDEKQIMYALERPWSADGVNFSSRIWANQKKLKQNLDNVITQGIMTGESYDSMVKKLERAMGTAYNNAARIIVTESAAIASKAQHDTFDELKIDKYVIRAVLDRATSQICQMLDGKEFYQKDYEVGVTAPPFHPNCRSSCIPKFDGDDFEERVARLPNFKGDWKSTTIKYMTYEEWADKYDIKPRYGRPEPGAKIELTEKDGVKRLKVTNPRR